MPPWWRGGEVVGAEGNHGISSNLSEKGPGQYFPQLIRTIISKNPANMASHLSHAYTYRLPEEQPSAVEISLRFPRISSFRFKFLFSISQHSICGICKTNLVLSVSLCFRWCLKLYCLVLAGLGLFLAGIWVIFLNNIWVIFLDRRKKITEIKIFSRTFFKMKTFHYKVPFLLSVTSN